MSARLTLRVPPDGQAQVWRDLARRALQGGVPPDAIDWLEADTAPDLLRGSPSWPVAPNEAGRGAHISRGALQLIETVLCHRAPGRFGLCYRVAWRLQTEPRLLDVATDGDVVRLSRLVKAVRRDLHKMKAFVRFREQPGDGGRRRFQAWFEPDNHVLHRVAPFFVDRFNDMDWLIATPRGAIAWNGVRLDIRHMTLSKPALSDDLDRLWRTYYGATFNPARVKIRAMQSEMPRKYWRNLPEAADIPALLAGAEARVRRMEEQRVQPAPAFHHSLRRRGQGVPLTERARGTIAVDGDDDVCHD